MRLIQRSELRVIIKDKIKFLYEKSSLLNINSIKNIASQLVKDCDDYVSLEPEDE